MICGGEGIAPLSFQLHAWSAWNEARPTPDCWLGNNVDSSMAAPGEIPMMLRRRATSVGRAAIGAAIGLPDVENARFVLATRYGELARTTSILNDLAQSEPVSPADFGMSVHHGLSGLLSIATKNKKGHSAVSAGAESFGYGMLEAASCAAENRNEPVILIYYDEKPDGGFEDLFATGKSDDAFVAALCIGGRPSKDRKAIWMQMSANKDGIDDGGASHLAHEFLEFVLSGEEKKQASSPRHIWEWGYA